ncbi:MAG: hypothetical protein CMB45_02970 [Euryarchaeota archaeon]|nr:hypothetical protein [Euryarchaeota archaeon]|tara:strand:+ start:4576 stop:7986 length:3411 start_codon:yes stop_codon:yes gene_type:complete
MTDYNSIPLRKSARIEEIESVKQLQVEDLRLAHYSNQALLYYISGGKEKAPEGITDLVRVEDSDLRGWFTEMYGENYLSYLTSDTQTAISTSDSVSIIKADFEANPFGYILRTGAVNEYHLTRIVTHANSVNKYRNSAISHSGNLVKLCSKVLFSGDIPSYNLFEILNSGINGWYELNGMQYKPMLGSKLHSLNLITPGSVNHTTYVNAIIMTLFDIVKHSSPADSWHNHLVPNAEVEGIDPASIKEIIEALDGASILQHTKKSTSIRYHRQAAKKMLAELESMETQGWNQTPKYQQKHVEGFTYMKEQLDNMVGPLSPAQEAQRTLYANRAAATVGTTELQRNMTYMSKNDAGEWSEANTNADFARYDAYTKKTAEMAGQTASADTKQTEIDTALAGGLGISDYHKTPTFEIWAAIIALQKSADWSDKAAATKWVKYIYARVKAAYSFNYSTTSLDLGNQVYSPFPALLIPTSYGQQVSEYDHIDISKVICFYGQALAGLTPTAYWNKSLSHRLFVRQEGGTGRTPSHSTIYLYRANMRTGGISGETAVIGKVASSVENTQVVAASILPDVPLYNPGTNFELTKDLNSSFETQVQSQPQLQEWLRQTNKEPFQYAYVIRSAWDPTYKIGKFKSKVATYLLGNRGRKWYESVTGPNGTNPPVFNRHIDWMRASTYSNSNYQGVVTFAPTIDSLRYDPSGKRLNHPEFYEAKNTIASTEMKCVAFPKAVSQKILEFMETVPSRLSEILNSVTNEPNSVWSEAHEKLYKWWNASMFGGWNAVESNWAEIPRKRYARAPGSGTMPGTFYDKRAFIDMIKPFAEFLNNRTELLLIKDPVNVINKAYNRMVQNKPQGDRSWEQWLESEGKYVKLTEYYDEADFGEAYSDYMALLATVAYLNSYHMLLDPPSQRTYPEWATPFKGKTDALVSSVLGQSLGGIGQGRVIYSSQINDTEDVSTLHRVLKKLGALEGMTELPVFDLPEFHVKWLSRGSKAETLSNPFVNGVPMVPVGGLEAQVYPGLSKTYGDVFYNSFLTSTVLQPVFKQPTSNYYMYSSLRIPVNTRGASSKLYGMRPGAAYSFDTVTDTQRSLSRMFTGSGGLTYTGLAGITGVAFVGLLGAAMFKNIDAEGAFADVRWKTE